MFANQSLFFMDTTWVKLYRKARENNIMQDPIAWVLFTYILLSVDRKTGAMRTGRIYLSNALKVNESTIYKALKRLSKKYTLIELLVTTKYTEIRVLKWHLYQSTETDGNNKVTTKEQQSNTIQEYRNKNNTIIEKKDLQEIADKYGVALEEVSRTYDNMLAWIAEVPKRSVGRNNRLTLMNWVRKNRPVVKQTTEQRIFTGTDGTRTYKYILVDGERKEVV